MCVNRFVSGCSASLLKTPLLVCSTMLLVACGAGGDETGLPVYQGQPADNITTESLQRNASVATGESLGKTMDSVFQTLNGSAAISKAFTIPGLGFSASPSENGVFNDPTEQGPILNDAFNTRVRTETSSTFESTLGLSGQANSIRTGNSIEINPDENDICLQQAEASDHTNCVALLADLTVHIDAQTDKSGVIQYQFRNNPVVEIAYSPVAGSYELKLGALHTMLSRMNELNPAWAEVPDSMSGAIKFQTTVLNDTVGAESGSLSLAISEALQITDTANETNVSIAPSTILSMTADSASKTATVEVSIGALSFASRTGNIAGNPLQKLVMDGMTARASLTRNGNVLSVSNVGLGNGPLVVSVDSLESVRATLKTFGFTVNQDSNSIVLNDNLDYSISLRNVLGSLDANESHNAVADYTLSAATGTVFSELGTGVMRIDQGGPLSVDFAVSDGNASTTGSVNVQQGQCFGENYQSDSPIDLIGCN